VCVACDKFGGYRYQPRTQENVRLHARFDHYGGDEEADMEAFIADARGKRAEGFRRAARKCAESSPSPEVSKELTKALGLFMAEYALTVKLEKIKQQLQEAVAELLTDEFPEYDRISTLLFATDS
jgi:hypothetical protein